MADRAHVQIGQEVFVLGQGVADGGGGIAQLQQPQRPVERQHRFAKIEGASIQARPVMADLLQREVEARYIGQIGQLAHRGVGLQEVAKA